MSGKTGYSRRQWFFLSGAILAVVGLASYAEAKGNGGKSCKDRGENAIKLTESAKIRHDAHAIIDGPWCGADNLTEANSPWRVRYSNAKQGLKIQYYNTLDNAKRAIEEFEPTKKFKIE